ncbi:hypothetical protein OA418_03235, partial [Candidatus Pelagibacter sp.]|nr:hypothetical protein [Candidatus Pelagibacter sp.]
GPFLLTIILIYIPDEFYPLKLIFLLLGILGIMSDKDFLTNPKIRMFIQCLLIFLFVSLLELEIDDLRIDILNNLLSNNLFNIFFTVFCIAILINGSNFIDGLNGLLSGYVIIVLLSVLFISYKFPAIILIDKTFLNIFIFALFIFFIFNISGYIFLGDSGSYVISLFVGFYLIKLYAVNEILSPYYIAAVLWYPIFENLFSFIRRLKKKIEISKADNFHLHHLFYKFIKQKKSIKEDKINSFCSLIILLVNIPSFLISNLFPTKTIILVSIIVINIIIYLFVYNFFSKQLKN